MEHPRSAVSRRVALAAAGYVLHLRCRIEPGGCSAHLDRFARQVQRELETDTRCLVDDVRAAVAAGDDERAAMCDALAELMRMLEASLDAGRTPR